MEEKRQLTKEEQINQLGLAVDAIQNLTFPGSLSLRDLGEFLEQLRRACGVVALVRASLEGEIQEKAD